MDNHFEAHGGYLFQSQTKILGLNPTSSFTLL